MTSVIRTFPDLILHSRSRKVTEFDNALLRLVESMRVCMEELKGVGIAANQVGSSQAVFIAKHRGANKVFVNPEIVRTHGRRVGLEGCLSIPGRLFHVARPKTVQIRYQDVDGTVDELYATDNLLVSIIMHEMDHLSGHMINDYCEHDFCACAFGKNRGGVLDIDDVKGLSELKHKFGVKR